MPLPLSTYAIPDGSAPPPRVIEGWGKPVAVTVKVQATPTTQVVALALVTAGAWLTVSVKL